MGNTQGTMLYKMNVEVFGDDHDLMEFINLLKIIRNLELKGSSRDVTVSVDGDGSASLMFQVDGHQINLIKDFDPDNIPTVYIGE